MAGRTTIEINGKRYDAATGKPVGVSGVAAKSTQKNSISPSKRRFIDGIHGPIDKSKTKPVAAAKAVIPKDSQKTTTKTKPSVAAEKKTRSAAPAVKRQPKRSQTLNRRGVNRPTKTKASAPATVSKPIQRSNSKTSSIKRKIDVSRLDKAKAVQRSSTISRFAAEKKLQETKKEPTMRPQKLHEHVAAAREVHKQQQATVRKSTSRASHKPARTKKRFAGAGMTALAIIILTGYVAYLNFPGISMKVASHRAGFAASLPRAPAGYSLGGPIASSSGLVTVDFKSNTDQRHFTLKQQPSSWDSQALLENEITKNHSNYVTYQDRGLTIYVYDGSNAAWVNGGKLFTINSENSQLTADQILSVAASM